jgi:hypothetical protein
MKKFSCLFILIAFLLSAGCAPLVIGGGAGAAGVIWYKGKLEDTIAAPLPKVHEAFVAGLKDLNIEITKDRSDALEGKIEAKLASNEKVWINLTAPNVSTTKATIRVGYLGDKEHSQRILEAARTHL